MANTDPVTDWAEDYNIFDADFVSDPYPTWAELRGKCPVAHTDRWGGSYMPVTYDGVTGASKDPAHLSSQQVTVAPVPISVDDDGREMRSVIASDGEDHTTIRRLLLPFFAPDAVEKYREPTRELCRSLIRGFIEDGSADAAGQYARQIPPRIIAEILGIDPERADEFTEWVQGVLELGLTDEETREHYAAKIRAFFLEEIERHREEPDEHLISYLLEAELDGEPVPMPKIRANLGLMLIAGIDTTWSSIGSALWHLAGHPEDLQRLVDDPELIPTAVEEFLRAYSPVTMARIAAEDCEVDGRQVKAGERVLLSFPAANRDPEVFENPEEVIIDRARNRHIAFGSGTHRCLGSNLARMEMVVAIEEFVRMIPEFTLSDPAAVTWAGGQVRGPRHLPVTFDPHQNLA